LRNLHTVFHSGYTNLHSYQQCASVPFSVHLYRHLLCLVFFIIAIPPDMKWYLIVLICIFLMTNDVEHLFHVPIGHLSIFFGKIFIQFLCQFFNFMVWSFAVELYEFLCILDINSLSDDLNIFYHCISWLFVLMIVLLYRSLFICCSPIY